MHVHAFAERPGSIRAPQCFPPLDVGGPTWFCISMAKRARIQQRMDEDPSGRLAQLQGVMHVRTVSSKAVRQILGDATASISPRESMTDAGQARYMSLRHTIRLPLEGGGHVDWELCHPCHLLSRVVSESPLLQEWFARALEQHPNSR